VLGGAGTQLLVALLDVLQLQRSVQDTYTERVPGAGLNAATFALSV
jgi:hypothetical protein